MFKLLIDTCVWIDLAKDYQQQPLLAALEELIQQGQASLILPRTVVDEFARNKARTVEESRHSLSATLKRVKDVVHKLGDAKQRTRVIEELNNIDHRLPTLGENVVESVGRIERLFKTTTVIDTSDAIKLRASERAIDERAPFHRRKNSIGDAILIETYAEVVADKNAKNVRFAFVTHNIKDFSATTKDNTLPHPDIAACFSKVKSLYFTTLGEALRRVEPELLADIVIEQECADAPRRLREILDAMDLLFHQVWYNRHQNTRYNIERGKTKIVERKPFPLKTITSDQFNATWGRVLSRRRPGWKKSTDWKTLGLGMTSNGE